MTATTIDEVIARLDSIIDSECAKNSRMAYFPILYRKVTIRIKEGILNSEFENNQRMEKLDVLFANRYIDAYDCLGATKPYTQSWKNAFEASQKDTLLIMQHLLLGINAHINLDLGIAVAETVGDDGELMSFENDFNKINEILGSMIANVEAKIISVSPLFGLLDRFGKGREDKLVSFSINVARDGAWLFANQYHFSPTKEIELKSRDTIIAILAEKLIHQKSWVLKYLVKTIAFFEKNDVPQIVAVLKKE
ncbi:hypothetical protein Aeqsu_1163 [Aequorivita sublithincola DSM 14238]|uniref:Uncharacterized protein n=1 Tax=Aequorivita sublithincola (strain DSM 14238 / LMG 21431 / ACAM 643 / 9-3) TaxID=746697 RepID=I3YUJ1_AEQSU|nr:DUF5995 family protein [Aequorivita sublithincola]AFL80659.1 hypothetical protein Aeqsu_1163 [Aequorivita sublithincola DSM 14238]